ncbi:hypothetical protein Pelo_2965 [Pelomyxa schiedti]|nr:hypothetical protein Pelo_2965 [Pelomyxa schiedti]
MVMVDLFTMLTSLAAIRPLLTSKWAGTSPSLYCLSPGNRFPMRHSILVGVRFVSEAVFHFVQDDYLILKAKLPCNSCMNSCHEHGSVTLLESILKQKASNVYLALQTCLNAYSMLSMVTVCLKSGTVIPQQNSLAVLFSSLRSFLRSFEQHLCPRRMLLISTSAQCMLRCVIRIDADISCASESALYACLEPLLRLEVTLKLTCQFVLQLLGCCLLLAVLGLGVLLEICAASF